MNKTAVLLASLFLSGMILHFPAVAANHSFDQINGVLSIDYPGYLAKHNIVFNRPITDSSSGLTVGNGRVGAMVWNANGLTMQVTGVDASPQACFSQGWLNLSTSPPMDSNYSAIQQTLNLYDGTLTIRYDNDRIVTIFGSPNSEVLGIHVEDQRININSVTFQVSMWNTATHMTSRRGSWQSMASDVPDAATWRTVTSFANATTAGISRGQIDINAFGYTLAASVEGASFTTRQVDNRTVQIQITPTNSYTIWVSCASRLNAPANNSVAQAPVQLAAAKAVGYAPTLSAFKTWWHDFWKKSFVQYSNSTLHADYLENYYYLANYLIASGAYGNYPFHFINGVYKNNADLDVHWSGGYWYWNQRCVYNSFLASNHIDVMSSLYRGYFRVLPALKSYTLSSFAIDGAWTPETMRWDGDARWTTTSDYVKNIFSTGAEVASNMFMRFAYTCDTAFLRDTAYPYMRESAKFLAAKLSFDATLKQYYMASSNAHENFWNVKNAITDLAAVRSLFPQAIAVSRALNVDQPLRQKWQNILDSLAPYKTEVYSGQPRYLPHDPPSVAGHNSENVPCELIWPYDRTGIDKPDYQIGVHTFKNRSNRFSEVWSPDPIQAARLGLTTAVAGNISTTAFDCMRRMLAKFQKIPNGLSTNSNGEFEFTGVHLIAMNESLLHSYNDTIRVFPAAPADPTFSGKFTLLAKGGFLVSSEKEAGEIKYVGIKSLYGLSVAIVNPWPGQQARVRKVSDNSVIATSTDPVISFATTQGSVYVVELQSKLLSTYTPVQVTASPNSSQKSMTFSDSTVTLGAGTGAVSVLPALPGKTIAPSSTIFKVSGDRFVVRKPGSAGTCKVAAYSISGRLIRSIVVTQDVVSLKKDLGCTNGAYVVRVTRLKPAE